MISEGLSKVKISPPHPLHLGLLRAFTILMHFASIFTKGSTIYSIPQKDCRIFFSMLWEMLVWSSANLFHDLSWIENDNVCLASWVDATGSSLSEKILEALAARVQPGYSECGTVVGKLVWTLCKLDKHRPTDKTTSLVYRDSWIPPSPATWRRGHGCLHVPPDFHSLDSLSPSFLHIRFSLCSLPPFLSFTSFISISFFLSA